jgi:hypothetical protein
LTIYEMWVRLQTLLETGSAYAEDPARDGLTISAAQIDRALIKHTTPSFSITQYFLTACVKPSPEILAILPDDLFTSC